MVLLLGASGYIGRAFGRELRRRGCCFVPLSREAFDYTCFEFLFDYVRRMKPDLLINAAGYAGWLSEDACEVAHEEALWANTILPQTIGRVCLMTNTPWGHVSSGSVFIGAKVVENGRLRIERDLGDPGVRELFQQDPTRFYGFSELDEPNHSFRHAPCNFFSGTKALAEEAIKELGQNFIWRLRLPFNEEDEPCNWLSELQRCPHVCDRLNSISHVDDGVRACLDLWERRAAFGVYNVTNPGVVGTRQVVGMIRRVLKSAQSPTWLDEEFEAGPDEGPAGRHGCLLDGSKLIAAGVKMRPAAQAIEDALEHWLPAASRPTQTPEGAPEPMPAAG